MSETPTEQRIRRARQTIKAGMEPCQRCGLPAEPATDYCGGCWYGVEQDREVIAELLNEAPHA